MRYTDRLAAAGIAPSVGSQGDAFDNALAESVIGLYKTEVIRRRGPWRSLEAAEFATLDWVDWFNMRRLLGPSGTYGRRSVRRSTISKPQWLDSTNSVSEVPGTIHVHVTLECSVWPPQRCSKGYLTSGAITGFGRLRWWT
jgi:putative transposase